MADETYDPPHDTGPPDPVETDPAALNSAEDLDEDRLRVDPLEEGMDPPEHWTAADKYGVTPWEQAHPPPLEERLGEEEPDVQPVVADSADEDETAALDDESSDEILVPEVTDDHPLTGREYDKWLGISADHAGGSVADEIRTPPPPL
jgi:hypothetical protein